MKQKINNIKWTKDGFTLIEVIITIVVLAVLAGMMVPYFGASFIHSSASIFNLNKSQSLNLVMEKISVQYAAIPHWRPQTTYAAGTIILPTTRIRNGYQYRSGGDRSGGGKSGTTQPSWPLSGTVSDGTITWTNMGNAPTLGNLQTCIGTEGHNYDNDHPAGTCLFGSYNVINNHFITFDANVEKPCTDSTHCVDNTHFLADFGRYLKVTIGFRSDDANGTGETLTTLFVLR